MKYQKPPLTYEQQLDLLVKRGLRITYKEAAISFLSQISYYRLSAYFLPFKQSEQFMQGTTFEDIMHLYNFDRKLRLLVLEAIEPIEISIRTKIIYHLSHHYGAFGYLVPGNFSNRFHHISWLSKLKETLERSTESFVQHYKTKYIDEDFPLWMALETISFGSLSLLFKGLVSKDQEEIAKNFGLKGTVLVSWLHVLTYIRNICAHHSRLWNKTLTLTPKLPNKSGISKNINKKSIYCIIVILQFLLHKIDFNSVWGESLIALMDKEGRDYRSRMGFPKDWKTTDFWHTPGTVENEKQQKYTIADSI